MKISELFPYTSRTFEMKTVLAEVKELFEATTREEVVEEIEDPVVAFREQLLYFHAKTGIDVWIPSCFTSAEKYIARMSACRELLKKKGLYDAAREQTEPLYFAKYTKYGSNMKRPHKRRQFLLRAELDQRRKGEWNDPLV